MEKDLGRDSEVGQSKDCNTLQVKLLWRGSPVEIKYFIEPKSVTIGSTKNSDFFLFPDDVPSDVFPVVRSQGTDDYLLSFTQKMTGELSSGEKTLSLAELVKAGKAQPEAGLSNTFSVPLPKDSVATLGIGFCTLEMRFVPEPAKVPAGSFNRVDFSYLNALLIALIASITLVISLFLFPFDLMSAVEDIQKNPNKFVNLIMTPAKPKQEIAEKLKQTKEADPNAKVVNENKNVKKDTPDVFKRSVAKKPDDKSIVQKAGLLKIFSKGELFSASNQIFGGKGFGGELQNALGGLFGTAVGDARGSGGLGLRGGGPGGGGGLSSIGIGTVGTRGRGGSGNSGYGYGAGDYGDKKDQTIGISGGTPLVLGSLDKELIRRVIHAHRNEIRYCYERALVANPGLWGKITVNFVIAANGSVQVSKVKETTMNNQDVENCIVQKVKTWKFPEPKSGGIVDVTYPFVLKQTD